MRAKSLEDFQQLYHARVIVLGRPESTALTHVEFRVAQKRWRLYIEEPPGCYPEKDPVQCTYRVLKALQDYACAEEYADWCQIYGLNPNDFKWLDYFLGMEWQWREIMTTMGEVPTLKAILQPAESAENTMETRIKAPSLIPQIYWPL